MGGSEAVIGSSSLGVGRLVQGKSFIGKDIKRFISPDAPKVAGVPDLPEFDAEKDRLLREALISRLRSEIPRGPGRAGTIATSAAGIAKRAPITTKKLTGV